MRKELRFPTGSGLFDGDIFFGMLSRNTERYDQTSLELNLNVEQLHKIKDQIFPRNNLDLQKLTEYIYYGLNRGKRKASRDIGYEAQVMLVTSLKASKLKDS